MFRVLQDIHKRIKDRFVYKSDISVWGKSEHWERYDQIPEVGLIIGDCDCFALACRRECRKQGISSRLVYCKTETGEGHLVLSADIYILDNRLDFVVKKSALDGFYTWFKISGYEKGDPWYTIKG